QTAVSHSVSGRDADAAVPYPLRVAAAVSWRALAVLGMVVVVGYALVALQVVVIPVAVALLLTALLGPMVDWLTRHRIPRGLATLVVLIAGLSLIGGLLAFVIQAFVTGLPALQTQVANSVAKIRLWLQNPPFGLPPMNMQNVLDTLSQAVSTNRNTITSEALSTAVILGQYLTGAALALFTLIYFLYGGRSMWCFLIRAVPRSVRVRVDVAGQRGFASLVGFIRATVLVAVVDAVGIGIGLVAVGAPLVLPLAALTFLAAFIPVIGTVVSGAVAVLVVLVTKGPVSALIVLGVVIGVQQLEGNVLQPLLLGRAVKLNGVAVVLAVAVGSVIAGIAGALLAVPLLAMLNAGIRALVSGDAKSPDVTSGRGTTGPVSGGAEGNGVVGIAGSAFPPADVPADPDGGSHNGAGLNGVGSNRAGLNGAGLNGAGLNRARSGPAHRRQ
ncbi:MAG TPA: AI-2E family transporter, partial [Pseudonocardiaceae bacterium]|nr:AI-2E family transporter [Pseudonocardiaceae bacterium]